MDMINGSRLEPIPKIRNWAIAILLLPFLNFINVTPVKATTYFISKRGSDANNGLSPISPWGTLEKINSLRLLPGDRVLLRAGDTFDGSLHLDETQQGALGLPIVIGSYGRGRARILALETGVTAKNVAHLIIRDLIIESVSRKSSSGSGIAILNTLPGNTKLSGITIKNVRVRRFPEHGVLVAGQARDGSKSGYHDVRITGVEATGNGHTGIRITGHWDETSKLYANHNVHISRSRAYENLGVPGYWNHSGSGIFVEDVNGAVIEHNIAFGNGKLSDSKAGGPIGIWAAVATNVVIKHNISHSNRSKRLDGGGFDLDGGTTNSTMQYNYAYDNDGAGFLLYNYAGAPHRFADNIVRCNISKNDGRNPIYGGITVGGHVDGQLTIADNLVVITPSRRGSPAAFKSQSQNVRASGNHFSATSGAILVVGQSGTAMSENTYESPGTNPSFIWNGVKYEKLKPWLEASAQVPSARNTRWKWKDRCSAAHPAKAERWGNRL